MAKKTSMKTALAHEYRALKIWSRGSKTLLISIVAATLFSKVTPYVTIYLSARIINMLVAGDSAENIFKLVLINLVVTAVLAFMASALQKWKDIQYGQAKLFAGEKVFVDKKESMDFVDAESQKVSDLESQIYQNMNWSDWGMFRAIYVFQNMLEYLVSTVCGISLSVSFFTLPVTNERYRLLNNPVIAFALLALMIVVIIVSKNLIAYRQKIWSDYAEDARLGNRYFSAFGWFSYDRERASDIRLYRQDKLTIEYMGKGESFTSKSSLAKAMRGKCGLAVVLASVLNQAMAGVIYFFVCAKAWAGAFPIGSATQYIAAVTGIFNGINSFLTEIEQMRINSTYLEQVYKFLDIPNNMYQGSLTTEKRSDAMYEVEFRNVSFKYPGSDDYALKNVNLKFRVGEKLAIVGMNGSGKTTFIKLLCRLYDPTEGTILLNGIDIKKYRYDEYRNIFSIVFQDFRLFAMPLGENVATTSQYDRARAKECLTMAGFGERLESMPKGLDTSIYKKLDKEGVEVSGGEEQKIALARAIYKDAPFVILDEPTAALDPVAESDIYTRFNEMVGDKTAVFISHRLSSCKFCDEIAVFHEGSVIQKGTHDELVSDESGKYYELWNAQAQYYNDDVAV